MLVKRIGNHDLPVPAQESESAAGYDLRTVSGAVLRPGSSVLLGCGFAFAIPTGWVGLIRDRSGLATKLRVTTRAGVIDSDYRGQVFINIVYEGEDWVELKPGDRIAQMVVVPHWSDKCLETNELPNSLRGENGIGSTGVA